MADTKISSLDTTNTTALRKKALSVRGALVGMSADLTAINASTEYFVPFDAESYDTDGIHDNVTNNSRLTVPSGWSWVRVGGKVFAQLVAVDEGFTVAVRHYNSAGVEQSRRGLPFFSFANADFTEAAASGESCPIAVNPGDYFRLRVLTNDTSVTISANHTSFWMELLS